MAAVVLVLLGISANLFAILAVSGWQDDALIGLVSLACLGLWLFQYRIAGRVRPRQRSLGAMAWRALPLPSGNPRAQRTRTSRVAADAAGRAGRRGAHATARECRHKVCVYCKSMNTMVPRLFRPGSGAVPPALTGRDGQQDVLSRCLGDLVGGSAPPHDVVLLGPRGNGKTALLHWFSALCSTASVDVVALTPQRIPNHEALVNALAPRRGIAKWLPRKVGVGSLGSAEWELEGRAHKDLTQALVARCRRRPVALLLDEAQALAPRHWQHVVERQPASARRCVVPAGARRHAGAAGSPERNERHVRKQRRL